MLSEDDGVGGAVEVAGVTLQADNQNAINTANIINTMPLKDCFEANQSFIIIATLVLLL